MTFPKLQLRLVSLYLALLFVVQAAGYVLIHHSLQRNARQGVDAQLDAARHAAEHLFADRQAELRRLADRLGVDAHFVSAWNLGDPARLLNAVRRSQADADANQLVVLDEQFQTRAALPAQTDAGGTALQQVWAAWLAEEPRGANPPPDDRLARVLRVDLASDVRGGQPAVRLWMAAPLRGPGMSGWLVRAVLLDDTRMAQLREVLHNDLAVVARRPSSPAWEVRAATLDAAARQALAQAWSGTAQAPSSLQTPGPTLHRLRSIQLATAAAGAPSTRAQPAEYHAVDLTLPYLRLTGGEEPELQLVVLGSVDAALAPYRPMQWMLLALGALGLAVFGIGALLTARRITGPLRELSISARRLSVGDYHQAVVVRSQDEIGDLAHAFETMRQAVGQREAEIRRLAFNDALTDLPNREQFRLDLRSAITAALEQHSPCSVLMLDLDRFKHVNDVLGHRFGDRVLRSVADRLREEVQGVGSVLARLGGDEFAVLLPHTAAPAARQVAQRILRGFEQPLVLDDNTVDLGAGIGIACCPDHATTADQLLARAEIGMYAAKQLQAGTVVYQPELDSTSQESLSLLGELRHAIDHDELRLVVQPKIDLRSGRLVGAEALLRWTHPQRGLVLPMSFVPFAEQTGFIRLLTGWLIERVCRELRSLHGQGLALKLSLNLSTRDLMDHEMPLLLARQIDHYNIDPCSLVMEITESAIMDDPQRALQTLMKLHDMGVKLSIDDFGVGYSSLAYLKRLPVDELKIDKSFVMNMETDLDDAKIVRSTIDLAHNLGLTVVAEGVESAKSWKMLAVLGCDQVQGYLVARPMPAEQFADWARRWAPPHTENERLATDFVAII